MDFDKDVDFWDMRMSILFFNFYCRVIVEVVEIKFGMLVLDIGCGLVFFFFILVGLLVIMVFIWVWIIFMFFWI